MLVVDASALAAVAFGEAEAPAVSSQLAEEALHAPSLLDLELANAACSRSRRHEADRARVLDGLVKVLMLPIERHPVDALSVLALALESGLTAYDAAYLWLARDLGAPLVTLDKQLNTAAKRYL